MLRSFKAEGIVIKRRNFGEADRILTVFTKYNGKIQVKAPGVRRITSRRSSHVELLNLSTLTLHESSRLFFPIVTEAQTLENFFPIKDNLCKIGYAYYICELINGLCPDNQENKKVFFLIKDTFCELISSCNIRSVVENFEDEFLVMLGFLPKSHKIRDKQAFIEGILERKLTTKRLLPLFLDYSKS